MFFQVFEWLILIILILNSWLGLQQWITSLVSNFNCMTKKVIGRWFPQSSFTVGLSWPPFCFIDGYMKQPKLNFASVSSVMLGNCLGFFWSPASFICLFSCLLHIKYLSQMTKLKEILRCCVCLIAAHSRYMLLLNYYSASPHSTTTFSSSNFFVELKSKRMIWKHNFTVHKVYTLNDNKTQIINTIMNIKYQCFVNHLIAPLKHVI